MPEPRRGVRIPAVVAAGTCLMFTFACQTSDRPSAQTTEASSADALEVDEAVAKADAPVDPSGTPEEVADDGSESAADAETGEGGEVAEGVDVAAPEGYGVFKFAEDPPSEDELPLYGLAGYEVVAVYDKPAMEGSKLGFLRIGTRMRVSEKIVDADCSKGWYRLQGGGYACASKGLVVDKREPYMGYTPTAAALDQPFPFRWAKVMKWNTPMWWRVPTAAELAEATKQRAVLEAERTGVPLPSEGGGGSGGDGGGASGDSGGDSGEEAVGADDGAAGEDEGTVDDDDGGEASLDDGAPDPVADPDPEPEEEPEPIKLPLNPGHPWMEKGFYVSLGESIKEGGRGYWRTARGGIIAKADAYAYDPKDFGGSTLTEEMSFPVGFVMVKDGTKTVEISEDGKIKVVKKVEKRTFFDLLEELEHSGRSYMATSEGPLVKKDVMRMPELQPMPKGLEPWDRWIDVDLTKQMLVAYEGSRPVYVTLVSTGKKGSEEEPFDTPTGRWRIYSKQVTSNMDGTSASDGNYALQDVPWVMYFDGSYALHGAFWHRSFGSVRSHGCVNLGPTDAQWLFAWTTPFVPESWHGAHASDENPGTTIVIRRS